MGVTCFHHICTEIGIFIYLKFVSDVRQFFLIYCFSRFWGRAPGSQVFCREITCHCSQLITLHPSTIYAITIFGNRKFCATELNKKSRYIKSSHVHGDGPNKNQNLFIKKLCIYMFKPSEYSPFDAVHLSRTFFSLLET